MVLPQEWRKRDRERCGGHCMCLPCEEYEIEGTGLYVQPPAAQVWQC